jgi:membrane-bound ClpP family serine protease
LSAVDFVLYGLIAVITGGLIIWFIFYAFSGQTKPPSNLTEETLARLIGSNGRATSGITEVTGTVFVNNEEFSAKTLKGVIQKGSLVRIKETRGLTLLVEQA